MQAYCIAFITKFAPVRIISLLLSLFILWLSCYPCSDGSMNNDVERHHEYSSFASADNSHTTPVTDLCSLLCGCHCCHIHAIVDSSPKLSFGADPRNDYAAYNEDFKNLESSKFIQPPIS